MISCFSIRLRFLATKVHLIIILGFFLTGCASMSVSVPATEDPVKLPHGVAQIVRGASFFDGGSVIIEFHDRERLKWQLYLNQMLADRGSERWGTITLTQIDVIGAPLIRKDGALIPKGSKSEIELIEEIRSALINDRVQGPFTRSNVDGFLQKIGNRFE